MANGWTPERRRRQAEISREWAPWKKSTGPKSYEGKARVSLNNYRGDTDSELFHTSLALKAKRLQLRDEIQAKWAARYAKLMADRRRNAAK